MQKIRKKYRTVQAVGPEHTDRRTHARTHESEFIGSFRSLKTSGEPKIKKIHRCIWKLQVKNSQNCQFWPKNGLKFTKFRHIRIFPAYRVSFSVVTRHSMIGSPERVEIQRSSIPKIRKIHSCVWKLYFKNSQNSQFLTKMAKFLS